MDLFNEEVWKNIEGFINYEVSNTGKIKNKITNKELAGGIKRGYRQVILMNNNKRYYKLVHRLVAETFIPNYTKRPQINHIDGNKLNNNVENLEWCTRSENMIHAYKTGLEKPLYAKENPRAKKVKQYDLNNNFIREYDGIREASRINNLNPRDISKCCKGIRKQVGGYIWIYSTNYKKK